MCSSGLSGDACEIWNEWVPRARKPYTCDGCGGPIAPGDRYLKHQSRFEGDWSSARMCLSCWYAREEFVGAHRGSLIPHPRMLADVISDCISDGDEDSETRWAPMLAAMRARGEAVAHG